MINVIGWTRSSFLEKTQSDYKAMIMEEAIIHELAVTLSYPAFVE